MYYFKIGYFLNYYLKVFDFCVYFIYLNMQSSIKFWGMKEVMSEQV